MASLNIRLDQHTCQVLITDQDGRLVGELTDGDTYALACDIICAFRDKAQGRSRKIEPVVRKIVS